MEFLEIAYHEIYPEIKLFDECVYLNYFQGPSEMEGETINIHTLDSEVALENLMVINEVLKPNKIIFESSKAFYNYSSNISKEQKNYCLMLALCHIHRQVLGGIENLKSID